MLHACAGAVREQRAPQAAEQMSAVAEMKKEASFALGTLGFPEAIPPLMEAAQDEDKGVQLMVEPAALLFLLGTEMDYITEKMSSRFVFNNPNQVSACGCGESIEIGFNPGFITDVLKVVDGADVMIELKAPNKPGVIRTGNDFTYVIMPVNLQ